MDLKRNMGKLSIIEQEFRAAEKLEQERLREEEEMRVRPHRSQRCNLCSIGCGAQGSWAAYPGERLS